MLFEKLLQSARDDLYNVPYSTLNQLAQVLVHAQKWFCLSFFLTTWPRWTQMHPNLDASSQSQGLTLHFGAGHYLDDASETDRQKTRGPSGVQAPGK